MNIYIATEVIFDDKKIIDKHVTLAFDKVNETKKLNMGLLNEVLKNKSAIIKEVVYWEAPDLTVALLDSASILEAHEFCKQLGFKYDLEFIPHVTLAKGDVVKDFAFLTNVEVKTNDTYLRIKDFN